MSTETRKPIPQEIITAILLSSGRRCCLCFGLNGDFEQKKGQIAHVDHNSANPDFDNLAFLCLNHHDQYDGKTRQSKGFTVQELKAYRDLLYQEVERRRNSPGGIASVNTDGQIHFDAGGRIQAVRKELGIKVSQFMEKLNYPSQRDYEAIEKRSTESPLYLLQQVHDQTGASLEWLKHGNEPRYDHGLMPVHPVTAGIKFFTELHPKNFYMTLETKGLHVGIIVQISDYHFLALDLGLSLDYWNWVDQLWAFSNFYQILYLLDEMAPRPFGAIIPTRIDRQLYEGKIHPLTALQHSTCRKAAWTDALLDYRRQERSAWHYRSHYGGWLIKVQDALNDHLEMMAEHQARKEAE
jgi:hypothetical protein